MSRVDHKNKLRSLMAKLSKRARGAANVLAESKETEHTSCGSVHPSAVRCSLRVGHDTAHYHINAEGYPSEIWGNAEAVERRNLEREAWLAEQCEMVACETAEDRFAYLTDGVPRKEDSQEYLPEDFARSANTINHSHIYPHTEIVVETLDYRVAHGTLQRHVILKGGQVSAQDAAKWFKDRLRKIKDRLDRL